MHAVEQTRRLVSRPRKIPTGETPRNTRLQQRTSYCTQLLLIPGRLQQPYGIDSNHKRQIETPPAVADRTTPPNHLRAQQPNGPVYSTKSWLLSLASRALRLTRPSVPSTVISTVIFQPKSTFHGRGFRGAPFYDHRQEKTRTHRTAHTHPTNPHNNLAHATKYSARATAAKPSCCCCCC